MSPVQTNTLANPAKILVVDDRPENIFAMEQILKSMDAQVLTAPSGNEALALMLHHEFAVAILDVQMPEMDGFELATLMTEDEQTELIPIIFVTANSKEQRHLFEGYAAGAVDYIFKPLDAGVLKSKVGVFLRLHQQQQMVEESNVELHRALDALDKANQKILEQQKAVIEEERLQVLLEMAGASVRELDQPLTVLLSGIEQLREVSQDPERMGQHLTRLQEASTTVLKAIENVQTIRNYDGNFNTSNEPITHSHQTITIVHIEDSEEDFTRVKDALIAEQNITLFHVKTIQEGLCTIRQETHLRFDLILTDYILTDGNGFDLLEQLNADNVQIPVVIITGQGNELVAAQLMQTGASDYLPKNHLSSEYLSKIIYRVLRRHRLENDFAHMQARLVETSTKDSLTGLYNRHYFMEFLTTEVERATCYKRNLALLIIDIDHFKAVNDTWGHQTGDDVLAAVADKLSLCSRKSDVVSRYGGEEFAVTLPDTGMPGARRAGEKLRQAVADMDLTHISAALQITISVGVAEITHDKTAQELIETADQALYRAKNNGRNRVEY